MVELLFSTTRNPLSTLIRLATWSRWSHVALVVNRDFVVEADAREGVRERPFMEALSRSKEAALSALSCTRPEAVIAAAMSQIGKPFDYRGALGLGLHRDWQNNDRWFCSELIAWSFAASGAPLFRAEAAHRVTPQHLWMLAPAKRYFMFSQADWGTA